MRSVSSRACALLVLVCLLWLAVPLSAQQIAPAARLARRAPLGAALTPPAVKDAATPVTVTARERPVWLFPLVGAAAGALIGLAIPDGCDQHDCTFSFPPPLLGAVYGAAIGLVVEIAL
jgi:hypothetical protein